MWQEVRRSASIGVNVALNPSRLEFGTRSGRAVGPDQRPNRPISFTWPRFSSCLHARQTFALIPTGLKWVEGNHYSFWVSDDYPQCRPVRVVAPRSHLFLDGSDMGEAKQARAVRCMLFYLSQPSALGMWCEIQTSNLVHMYIPYPVVLLQVPLYFCANSTNLGFGLSGKLSPSAMPRVESLLCFPLRRRMNNPTQRMAAAATPTINGTPSIWIPRFHFCLGYPRTLRMVPAPQISTKPRTPAARGICIEALHGSEDSRVHDVVELDQPPRLCRIYHQDVRPVGHAGVPEYEADVVASREVFFTAKVPACCLQLECSACSVVASSSNFSRWSGNRRIGSIALQSSRSTLLVHVLLRSFTLPMLYRQMIEILKPCFPPLPSNLPPGQASTQSTQALRTQELTALQNQDSRRASGDLRRQDLPRTASFSLPSLQVYLAIKKPATMLSAKCPPASTNSTSATANPLQVTQLSNSCLHPTGSRDTSSQEDDRRNAAVSGTAEGLGVNIEGEGGDEGEGNDDDDDYI
ncbi:hypothetical protein C8J57DRAFT_1230151 [Mycena rebaudengoi]|nr:hypothetical protein C8J57DRAFT_1230151 [Mycena rebaudengoi]